MRRQIRLQINLVAEVDDDRDGVPFIADVTDALWRATCAVLPGAVGLLPGGRLAVGLTRESRAQAKKAQRTKRTEGVRPSPPPPPPPTSTSSGVGGGG